MRHPAHPPSRSSRRHSALHRPDHGRLESAAGTLDIAFMRNCEQRIVVERLGGDLLVLGVPAAYAFARFKFR